MCTFSISILTVLKHLELSTKFSLKNLELPIEGNLNRKEIVTAK